MLKKFLVFVFLSIMLAGSTHATSQDERSPVFQEAQHFVQLCKEQGISEDEIQKAFADQLKQVAFCLGSSEVYEEDGDTCSQKTAKIIFQGVALVAFLISMYVILTKIFKVKSRGGARTRIGIVEVTADM